MPYETVNIIGAGLAGLAAAVTLAEADVSVNLVSVQPSERAQSVLAAGGINGALNTMGEDDCPENHFADTIRAGCGIADPEAVRALTEHAPQILRWLDRLGVPFNRTDSGAIMQRNFGGQKKKRTAYAKSSTGKMLMTALIDEVRKYEAAGLVKRCSHHEFLALLMADDGEQKARSTLPTVDDGDQKAWSTLSMAGDGDQKARSTLSTAGDGEQKARSTLSTADDGDQMLVCGAWIRDTHSGEIIRLNGPVILAFGGMNGMFPGLTTGTTANTGDGAAAVFAQGIRFSSLEMIQYHPTTMGIAGKRCLVSEAARGEGSRLFIMRGGKEWYFMDEKYPELGSLMPRDVVAREMYFVKRDPGCEGQVYLDMRHLSEEIWSKRLADLRAEILHYFNLDPKEKPLPVDPGIHYFMGGIDVDVNHRTIAAGLYAAGECCSQYHGANRLGGNSMLGAIYGGMTAARCVVREWDELQRHFHKWEEKGCTEGRKPEAQTAPGSPWDLMPASPALCEEVSLILSASLGIVRNGDLLADADRKLTQLLERGNLNRRERNRVYLALAMVRSAELRRESRGAHYREDYPERDETFRGMMTAVMAGDEIRIGFRGA